MQLPRINGPAILIVAAALSGCGDDGREPRHPASGRVVVDGRPEAGIEVRLYPADRIDDLDAPRPFATTGEDGVFRLGTDEEADGAPAGSYTLTLFWPDRPPGPSPPEDRLGGRFSDPKATEFTVSITEGDNDLGPFEVESTPVPTPPRAGGLPSDDVDGFGGPPDG
jgi:hypothetical protein